MVFIRKVREGVLGGRPCERSRLGVRFDVAWSGWGVGAGSLKILVGVLICIPSSGATTAWQCFVWKWLVGTWCVDSTDPFAKYR